MVRRSCCIVMLAATVSGCALGPSEQDIRQVHQRVEGLGQRITRLEQLRHSGSSSSVAAGTFESSATPVEAAPLARSGPLTKLLRGGVNLITGWIEIPKRMQETTQRSGAAAGWTWGLTRGIGYGFIRSAGGLYELVTFPFPAPADYQPLMRPEFVFQADAAP